MKIIDAHNHPYLDYHTLQSHLQDMDEQNISQTWLLTFICRPGEYRPQRASGNGLCHNGSFGSDLESCLDYVQKAPDRFLLGYAPDPRDPDALERMTYAIRTLGARVCGEMKYRMMYDNPDAIDLYRLCGEYGLPVVMHFDLASATRTGAQYPRASWWYGGDIDTLERVLKQCPETNFLGHAPGFWCELSNDDLGRTNAYPTGPIIPGGKIEKLLDQYPNLYCDCSAGSCLTALRRDTEYTRKLMLAHPDRFLFARDGFGGEHRAFFESLDLPADVQELLYHGNAERLTAATAK